MKTIFAAPRLPFEISFGKYTGFVLILVFAVPIWAQISSKKKIPVEWQTLAEKTAYRKTARFDETVAFSRKLDAHSELIVYQSFGKSSEGRDLPLLIAAKDRDFTPARARAAGKAVILIQAAIHSGESDGKDAGLALFRDIAVSRTRLDLLENVVLVFIPIYNVDGHELFSKFNRINQNGPEETGFRANSANQNLNRDYMKADTPETIAWLELWNQWQPDFFIDCHVTDGADFRYNITYEFAHHAEISEHLKNWMNEHFERSVVPRVEAQGNLLARYLQFIDSRDPAKGTATFIATPRFATGYTPLKNRNGLLIEAHSVKPYESRVLGTYDVLRFMIEEIGKNKKSLFEANRRADLETIEKGKRFDPAEKFPLELKIDNISKPFEFKGLEIKFEESPISGARAIVYGSKPFDRIIPQFDSARVEKSVAPPLFYIIPPQWIDVIKRLDYHHIKYERLPRAREFEIESYRFENPKWANAPFEGRITLSYKTVPVREKRMFPKNSVIVPLAQKNAKVAVHWLEPAAPDSAMFWGFFNAIFEQKEYSESYVMEEIARKMLAADENLRREFEEKLKIKEFAENPRARLQFFYERSPFYDRRIGQYPVGRILNEIK